MLVLAPPALGQAANLRLGYVNVDQVMQSMPEFAKAESTLTREMRALQAEIEKMQQRFDSTTRAFDQQSVVLSPSARQTKQREIQELSQQLQQRMNDASNRVQRRERELVQPLEDRVKGIIEGLRAERNLALVFNVSGPVNAIVAADRSLDLTPTIIQRLKSSGGQ
jgi:outer membrane protein